MHQNEEEFIKIHYQSADRLCFFSLHRFAHFRITLLFAFLGGNATHKKSAARVRAHIEFFGKSDGHQNAKREESERTGRTKRQTIFGSHIKPSHSLLPFKNGQKCQKKTLAVRCTHNKIKFNWRDAIEFEYITEVDSHSVPLYSSLAAQKFICIKLWTRRSNVCSCFSGALTSPAKLLAHKLRRSLPRSIIITKQEINFLIVNIKRTKMCRKSTSSSSLIWSMEWRLSDFFFLSFSPETGWGEDEKSIVEKFGCKRFVCSINYWRGALSSTLSLALPSLWGETWGTNRNCV